MKYLLSLLPRHWSKWAQRLLGFLAVFALSGIALQGNVGGIEEAYAQTNEGTVQQISTESSSSSLDMSKMDLFNIVDLVLKVVYIILWPLLVIAGRSLDNTLVYGSVFHLDAPLWKFRNMLKNFANFTLWFLVLFAILKSIFSNKGAGSFKDETSPLGVIKKTLIAGVLIQASWFLTAAMIDLSTVATYAVGGLPMNVIKNTDVWEQKMLTVNSSLDLNNFSNITQNGDNFKVRYSTKDKDNKEILLSPCKIQKWVIIGREYGDDEYRHDYGAPYAGYQACVLFGKQVVMFKEDAILSAIEKETWRTGDHSSNLGYQMYLKHLVPTTAIGWTWSNNIITQYSGLFVSLQTTSTGMVMGKQRFDSTQWITLSSIISKSKWFVWPLVTLYSSLLNFAQLSDTNDASWKQVSGEFLIKSAIAIALIFPLVALTVVLIMRIAYLWVVIAASPFIILTEVFKKQLKIEAITKNFSLEKIISVMFSPVITVFALSMAIIFMSVLLKSFSSTPTTTNNTSTTVNQVLEPEIHTISDTEHNSQKVIMNNGMSLEFQNFNRWGTLDRFSRLIVNFIAVWLVWALLFAAIKANKFSEKIAWSIGDFWGNFFSTLPIMPIPGGGWERVGLGSAARVLWEAPNEWMANRVAVQQNAARSFIKDKYDDDEGSSTSTKWSSFTSTQKDYLTKLYSEGKTSKDINFTELNAGSPTTSQINATGFNMFSNSENFTTIANSLAPNSVGLQKLSEEWQKSSFTPNVTNMDKSGIESALNLNEATKAYAKTLTTWGQTIIGKDKVAYTVKESDDGKSYIVNPATPST